MSEIILPEVELNIYSKKNPVEVTVVENYVVTKESSPNYVRHITFDISGTELAGRVRVGQSIGILPPGVADGGREHKLRLYSISSPSAGENGKRHLISTTVKRTIEELGDKIYLGVASNYLADLKPGEKVNMTGPSGRRFLLPENASDFNYIFFATGTGIAPFRGMIHELFNNGYNKNCILVFGCSYRTDLLYADYFEDMDAKSKNFKYITCISREGRRVDGTKKYVQTALVDHQEIIAPVLDREDTLLYICGMKGMETGIYHELVRQNFYDYLDIKKDLPDDPDAIRPDDIKEYVKPGIRTFEEVY
jgi:ferredoxin--NADP+ reductase